MIWWYLVEVGGSNKFLGLDCWWWGLQWLWNFDVWMLCNGRVMKRERKVTSRRERERWAVKIECSVMAERERERERVKDLFGNEFGF